MQSSRTQPPTSFQNSLSSLERGRVHASPHWLQAVPPHTTKLSFPAQNRRCQVLKFGTGESANRGESSGYCQLTARFRYVPAFQANALS
jgi:hypothetical protein